MQNNFFMEYHFFIGTVSLEIEWHFKYIKKNQHAILRQLVTCCENSCGNEPSILLDNIYKIGISCLVYFFPTAVFRKSLDAPEK